MEKKKRIQKLATPRSNTCSRVKSVLFDFTQNYLNSTEHEKLEENKNKPQNK